MGKLENNGENLIMGLFKKKNKISKEEKKRMNIEKNIHMDVRHVEWSFVIVIYFKKKCIGKLKGVIKENGLFIGDIEINEVYRNCGIGTITVNRAIEFAKNNEIKKITGNISKIDEVERLCKFYENLGFQIAFKEDGNIVANIEKIL